MPGLRAVLIREGIAMVVSCYTCPSDKRRYATKDQAEDALDRIWHFRLKGEVHSEKIPCRSYGPCELCKGGYHHTSQPYRPEDNYDGYLEEQEYS